MQDLLVTCWFAKLWFERVTPRKNIRTWRPKFLKIVELSDYYGALNLTRHKGGAELSAWIKGVLGQSSKNQGKGIKHTCGIQTTSLTSIAVFFESDDRKTLLMNWAQHHGFVRISSSVIELKYFRPRIPPNPLIIFLQCRQSLAKRLISCPSRAVIRVRYKSNDNLLNLLPARSYSFVVTRALHVPPAAVGLCVVPGYFGSKCLL